VVERAEGAAEAAADDGAHHGDDKKGEQSHEPSDRSTLSPKFTCSVGNPSYSSASSPLL